MEHNAVIDGQRFGGAWRWIGSRNSCWLGVSILSLRLWPIDSQVSWYVLIRYVVRHWCRRCRDDVIEFPNWLSMSNIKGTIHIEIPVLEYPYRNFPFFPLESNVKLLGVGWCPSKFAQRALLVEDYIQEFEGHKRGLGFQTGKIFKKWWIRLVFQMVMSKFTDRFSLII